MSPRRLESAITTVFQYTSRRKILETVGTRTPRQDAFDDVVDKLDRLARGLRRRDQDMLDELLVDAQGYRDALHLANPTDPWITVLLCICLTQQRALGGARIPSTKLTNQKNMTR